MRFYHGPFQYHIDIKLAQAGKAKVKKYRRFYMMVVTLVILKELKQEGFYTNHILEFKILFIMSLCNTAWEGKIPNKPISLQ